MPGRTAYEMERDCKRSAAKADSLKHQAAVLRNSEGGSNAESRARQLNPLVEGPQQILETLTGEGG